MLDELVTAYGNRFVVAALGVVLAMGCLIVVLWFLKKRSPSPFIRGSRNRLPRLQVLDAAAVDARRRLVLVRRDNVEHLIMIGGPTDLVIESRIGEQETYMAEVAEQPPQQIAAAPPRQVAETPAPAPAALPRVERQRPQPVAAEAPAPPPRAPTAPAQAPRQAVRQPQAPVVSQREEPMELALEEEDGNSFFYDEFYDDTSEEDEIADLLEATRERVFADREPPAVAQARAPQPAVQEPPPRQPRATPQPAPAQNFSASEFERVLEEEMAMHLTTEPQAARTPPRPAAPQAASNRPTIAPPRPIAPPLTARTPETRRPEPRAPEPRQAATAPTPARPALQPAARPAVATPARPAPAQRPAAAAPSRPGTQPNLQNEIARIFGEMSTKREK